MRPPPPPFSPIPYDPSLLILARSLSTSTASTNNSSVSDNERDEGFIKILHEILHSKHSWRISLNAPFVSHHLHPRHVKALLLQFLDHPCLALRFFNFIGLHRGFPHSLLSFSILALALLHIGLHWPASSLLQSLASRHAAAPADTFHSMLRSCNLYPRLRLLYPGLPPNTMGIERPRHPQADDRLWVAPRS